MTESSVARPIPFISYSANSEDVILHRLFGGRSRGLYVDVGAAHPTFENDTRALYDQGWSGLNVEPNPSFFPELASARPRDRNYQLALSDEEGSLAYWEVAGTGLSTCDTQEAQRASAKGFAVRETRIPCTTLARLLDEAQPAAIDLLKVDVEGFELRVLQGNDWTRFRPSVILVEVTYPETPTRRPERLRPFLEQNGYSFVYFDGLNDFFTDRTFSVPDGAFLPPNVFDQALPFAVASMREHVVNLERGRDEQGVYIESLRVHVKALEQERTATEAAREHELASQDSVASELRSRCEATELERTVLSTQVDTLQREAGELQARAAQVDTLQREAGALQNRFVRLEAAATLSRAEASRLRHDATVLSLRGHRDRDEATRMLEITRIQAERLLTLQRELEHAALVEQKLHLSLAEQAAEIRSIQAKHETAQKAADLALTGARADLVRQEGMLVTASRERAMLVAMYASTSWRVSRPLRALSRLVGRVR